MNDFINSFSFFNLEEPQEFYEVRIQSAWNDIIPNQIFKTIDNQEITIHSPGTWNTEAGPDFINAKISIKNKIITGDIEIHYNSSDWLKHGHSNNMLYDNVILHVVYYNDSNNKVFNRFPTIVISSLLKNYSNNDNIEKVHNGLCSENFSAMNDNELSIFFKNAGQERFRQKSELLMKNMLANEANDVFLEKIFETMGYKKNNKNFIELYKRLKKYDKSLREKYFVNILWGESGIMPDPAINKDISIEMLEFIKSIWAKWWDIRTETNDPIKWVRFGLRPLNTPERRIAAITGLLDKISLDPIVFFKELILKYPTAKEFWNISKDTLVVKNILWGEYSTFRKKRNSIASVLGEGRLLDLIINVILPAIYAHSKINRDNETAYIAEKIWLELPKAQNNKIIKNALARWINKDKINYKIKHASIQQGIIHLYRNTCIKNYTDCQVCLYRDSTKR